MFNKDQHPESFRHEFVREVIFPLVAVLIIIWSAASFSLLWTSHHNNAEAVTQQESIIKTAFVQSMTEHQRQLHSLTNWPPFGQLLQQPQIDLGWLDDNVGRWLYEMFGHQDIFIIDPQETILAGWQNGQRIDNSRWPAFERRWRHGYRVTARKIKWISRAFSSEPRWSPSAISALVPAQAAIGWSALSIWTMAF